MTQNLNLVKWEVAKAASHDSSGVGLPEHWLWKKSKGIFYPEKFKLDDYLATSIAEGFCEGENATYTEQQKAWQYLHTTRLAYRLQGWFGRQCKRLIDEGIITE